MVERRRDLHRYPETGWAEFRTTTKIAEALAGAGMDIRFAERIPKLRQRELFGRELPRIS